MVDKIYKVLEKVIIGILATLWVIKEFLGEFRFMWEY